MPSSLACSTSSFPADDFARVHAEAPQLADAGIADIVIGQDGHKGRFHAVVGQRNADVGLAAAKGGLQYGRLEETFISGALEAKHDLAKSNDFLTHGLLSFLFARLD